MLTSKDKTIQKLISKNLQLEEALCSIKKCIFLERKQVLKLYHENDKLSLEIIQGRKYIENLNEQLNGSHKISKNYCEDCCALKTKLQMYVLQFREQLNLQKDEQILDFDAKNAIKIQYEQNLRFCLNMIDEIIKTCDEKHHDILKFEKVNLSLNNENIYLRKKLNEVDVKIGNTNITPISSLKNFKEQLHSRDRIICTLKQQIQVLSTYTDNLLKDNESMEKSLQNERRKNSSEINILKKRYEKLNKRRLFENEGFSNDIKQLRERLKKIEKDLFSTSTPK